MLIAMMIALALQAAEQPKLALPKTRPSFALAKASQDGRSIALTERGGSRVETYIVNVPVVETVKDKDGNERQVTRLRQETRTRVRPAPLVAETYTVMVARETVKTDKDGKVNRTTVQVPQTRTRMVRARDSGKPRILKISECEFTDILGKPVADEEVAKRLAKRSPVVVLYGRNTLDPFYRVVLNQKTLVMKPPVRTAVVQPPAAKKKD